MTKYVYRILYAHGNLFRLKSVAERAIFRVTGMWPGKGAIIHHGKLV